MRKEGQTTPVWVPKSRTLRRSETGVREDPSVEGIRYGEHYEVDKVGVWMTCLGLDSSDLDSYRHGHSGRCVSTGAALSEG